MAYLTLLQRSEIPIREKWTWETDIIVADDGTEQRISLCELPKRSWNGQFSFSAQQDINYHQGALFALAGSNFTWPLGHMAVKLKQPAPSAQKTIFCNTARSDFRSGAPAFIIEGSLFEFVTIDEVLSDRVTVVVNLVNSYSARAQISPVASVYTNSGVSIIRRAPDGSATSNYNFFEYGFQDPFVAAPVELDIFLDYPLLNIRADGSEFTQALDTHIEVTDYGGQPSLRTSWVSFQFESAMSYLSNHIENSDSWNFWRSFASYCKGSVNPFYVPSWRSDFTVVSGAVGTGTQFTIKSHNYRDTYYSKPSFRTIVITAPDGRQHFASITAVVNSGSDDLVTFSPALPLGDWTDHSVSFLYKCRITDDAIAIDHYGLHSLVNINIRTVD